MVATPSTQALSGLSAVTEARPTKDGELGRTGIDLFNGSNERVYRLVVGIAFIQGTPTRQPSRSVSGSFRVTTVNEDLLPRSRGTVHPYAESWTHRIAGWQDHRPEIA